MPLSNLPRSKRSLDCSVEILYDAPGVERSIVNPSNDKIYDSVLSEVLWGADRKDVMTILHESGVFGDAAEELFRRARKQRIALIRVAAMRRIGKGVLLMAFGGLILTACGMCYLYLGKVFKGTASMSSFLGFPGFVGAWYWAWGFFHFSVGATRQGSIE